MEPVLLGAANADDEAEDASASFTLTAPGTRRFETVKADNDDANADSAEADAGKEEDEPQTAVSASYTIVSRREKPVDQKESEEEQPIKTDSDEANQRTRPTELSLALTESKPQATTTPVTPATTPGAVESPVRLRDKRSLSSSIGGGSGSGAGGDADAKSETASPVAAHADFNARDSLLSLYARGAGVAAPAPAAPSASSSAAERRPSWRLKFDAGSKVKHTLLQQEQWTIT